MRHSRQHQFLVAVDFRHPFAFKQRVLEAVSLSKCEQGDPSLPQCVHVFGHSMTSGWVTGLASLVESQKAEYDMHKHK